MLMVRQSRSLEILICLPRMGEPMVIRSTFLFPIGIGKTDDPAVVSSLAFSSGTKI